jgi:AhpD family alkylhydroperoxidase
MEARMQQPAMVVPDAMQPLQDLGKALRKAGPTLPLELLHLRASQINGCSVCVDMHAKALKQSGETDERLFAVAAWREAPYFDDDERAALALAEAMTRLSDRPDPVSDEVWAEAAKHYTEEELATITLSVASVNLWNRLNAATRQVAGAWAG